MWSRLLPFPMSPKAGKPSQERTWAAAADAEAWAAEGWAGVARAEAGLVVVAAVDWAAWAGSEAAAAAERCIETENFKNQLYLPGIASHYTAGAQQQSFDIYL